MDCEKWLFELLADLDYHLCDDVREKAQKAGYTKKELKDARKSLCVKTYHQFDEEGATPNWFWYLEKC